MQLQLIGAFKPQLHLSHSEWDSPKRRVPAKILLPFLPTAPLQYVPKIRFTQTTIDCLTANKTKNVLFKETVILNYIGDDPISHGLHN